MDCICETVSECVNDTVCIAGDWGDACGRYRITPHFWRDSGKPTLSTDDDPESPDAFKNCATDRQCASRSVQQYMENNKKDCNGDGAIDCHDFYALHLLGTDCGYTLHKNFIKRFARCDQPLKRNNLPDTPKTYFLPNLDDICTQCLCDAPTGCNMTFGCQSGYCGHYKISKIYWKEAGSPVIPGDDPERVRAFEDCAFDKDCAERTVKQYLRKFGKDCNNDGVTDCYDYMMINFNGGYGCNQPLDRNEFGRGWVERYNKCRARENLNRLHLNIPLNNSIVP